MTKSPFLFLFLLLSGQANAQAVGTPMNASYSSICAYSGVQTDAFSFAANQAALAAIKKFSGGLAGERRFLLQDLASCEAGLVLPTGSGSFGLHFTYFGNQDYHQLSGGLAYARRMGKLDFGVQGNYFLTGTKSYGSNTSLSVEGGVVLQLTDKLRAGFHLYNPYRVKMEKDIRTQSSCSAGIGYDASKNFFLGFSIEKTENLPVNVMAGFHFSFSEKLFVRAVISTGTPLFLTALGFYMHGIRIDVSAILHPYLGMTPGMIIHYRKPVLP